MRIGVVSKHGLSDPHRLVRKAVLYLTRQKGVTVNVCEGTCLLMPGRKPDLNFEVKYDVFIIFGGDGTLLRTLQFMKHFETPVLLINMGRVGFFSEGKGKDYKILIDRLLSGAYRVESRMLLRCSVMRNEKRVLSQRVLNEVTIARDALARMVSLKAMVDNVYFTTYVADGLIISSPSGSTAYTIAAGGPIVSPDVESIILTPLAPHSFAQKSIVLPSRSKVSLAIPLSEDRVFLTLDGQQGFQLKGNDVVKVKRSSQSLQMIRFSRNSYFKTLRLKLHWGRDPL